jgi:hypothetical protein
LEESDDFAADDSPTDSGAGSCNEQRLFNTPGYPVSVTASTKRSNDYYRGPGPGAKKTKKLAKEEEYRKKKTKLQESMVELATKRAADFTQYVNNQARAQAWNMAMSGYNTFKDSDPERAEQYKKHLDKIMFGEDGDNNDDSSN